MIYNQAHTVANEFGRTGDKEISRRESRIVTDTTDKDIFFAKERYKLHQTTPNEGVYVDALKKYFSKKYGF